MDAGNNWGTYADVIDVDEDGDLVELTPHDVEGNPRFADATSPDTGCGVPVIVDLGAYERAGTPVGGAVYLADIDANGAVGFTDLLELLGSWGPCPPCCLADFDFDGFVGLSDLLVLLAGWS